MKIERKIILCMSIIVVIAVMGLFWPIIYPTHPYLTHVYWKFIFPARYPVALFPDEYGHSALINSANNFIIVFISKNNTRISRSHIDDMPDSLRITVDNERDICVPILKNKITFVFMDGNILYVDLKPGAVGAADFKWCVGEGGGFITNTLLSILNSYPVPDYVKNIIIMYEKEMRDSANRDTASVKNMPNSNSSSQTRPVDKPEYDK